jgi:hypothetical protein
MVARADLRIGDADREAAAASLRENYAQGRLSLEEFNQRLDAAFGATTQGQLDQVTGDLPSARTPAAPLPGGPAGYSAPQQFPGQPPLPAQSQYGLQPGQPGRNGWNPGPGGGYGPGAGYSGPRRHHSGLGIVLTIVGALFLVKFALHGPAFWGRPFGILAPWPILLGGLILLRGIVRRIFGWGRRGRRW